MPHAPHHLVTGVVALAATLLLSWLSSNRLAQRKLRVTTLLFVGYVLGQLVYMYRPGLFPDEGNFREYERLTFAAGLISLFVVGLLNPHRSDRVPDRFPSIVQDAIIIGLLLLVATFAFGDKFIATSAVSAVVIGFALQDTLGNAFAGLAIQSEKPFRVGHWVTIGDHEGRVSEVTWRATKLRTKSGNFVILPNSEVGKLPITNFSEPLSPTRLSVEVGVSYDAAPNRVKSVLLEGLRDCPLVLQAPAPQVLMMSFDDSSIRYRVQYWVDDYEKDEVAWDQVRTSIYYIFRRHGIEIPYPIAIEYGREDVPVDVEAQIGEREALLNGLDFFAPLSQEQRHLVAASTRVLTFGDGQVIVREGDPGETMYVVVSGKVVVTLAAGTKEVATIEVGGYFGEMSLLTGAPRSATVCARGDATVLEISVDVFRQLAQTAPQAIEEIGVKAATRRIELDAARASVATTGTTGDHPRTLLARMRRFLRMAHGS